MAKTVFAVYTYHRCGMSGISLCATEREAYELVAEVFELGVDEELEDADFIEDVAAEEVDGEYLVDECEVPE